MTTLPPVDLRSDTRTVPDEATRQAMASAVVGDDSYGDDPTVRTLEAQAAELTGMAAAVFTCSGTMSNLLAVLARTTGDRPVVVVAGEQTHLLCDENDGVRRLARCAVRTVPDGPDGDLDLACLEQALVAARAKGQAPLVWLENPHNRRGGAAQPPAEIDRRAELAHRHGAEIHLDGARLPHASVAFDVALRRFTAGVDTVAISFCKGLGAPVGSVLCGPTHVIGAARAFRTMVGGTLHQAGVLAAAGLLALDRIPQLERDHVRTAELAHRLADVDGLSLHPPLPTNMLVLEVADVSASAVLDAMAEHGVLALALDERRVRIVVHRDHAATDLDAASHRIAAAVAHLRRCTPSTRVEEAR